MNKHLFTFDLQDMNGNLVENPILSLIETTSVAWFTMEYLLRFVQNKYIFEVLILSFLPGLQDLQRRLCS